MLILEDKGEIAAFAAAHTLFVALGYFDGVHRGHQALLDCVTAQADAGAGEAGVLLLEPHPAKVLKGNGGVKNLNTLKEKIKLIQEKGTFHIFILHFDESFAKISPQGFVKEYLVGLLQVKGVVCGFNYSFGQYGAGKSRDLARLGEEYGFACHQVPPVYWHDQVISSTEIRQHIEAGDMEGARQMLGHPHVYSGYVVSGNHLGVQMGIPTANLALATDMIWPAYGVYGAFIQNEAGQVFRGIVNAGIRPTVRQEEKLPSFEVHLQEFSGNLYGAKLKVILTDLLRREQQFAGLAELAGQIAQDEIQATQALAALAADLTCQGRALADYFV